MAVDFLLKPLKDTLIKYGGHSNVSIEQKRYEGSDPAYHWLNQGLMNETYTIEIDMFKAYGVDLNDETEDALDADNNYTINEEQAQLIIDTPVHPVEKPKHSNNLHLSKEEQLKAARKVLDKWKETNSKEGGSK